MILLTTPIFDIQEIVMFLMTPKLNNSDSDSMTSENQPFMNKGNIWN